MSGTDPVDEAGVNAAGVDATGVNGDGVNEEDGWRRLSPWSPVVRLGVVAIAVLGYFVAQFSERIFNAIGGSFWGSRDPSDGQGGIAAGLQATAWLGLGILVLVLAVVGGAGWMSWRFSRFRVTEQQVEFRKGWLFREHRQVPIDRIQAVEIGRPLLAQLLRLAEVVVQSAGGSGSQLKISFLPLAEAQQVRLHIQRLAISTDEERTHASRPGGAPQPAQVGDAAGPGDGSVPQTPQTPQGPEGPQIPPIPADGIGPDPRLPGDLFGLDSAEGRTVLAVPNGRLFAATMMHSSLFALLGVALIALATTFFSGWGPLDVALASIPAMGPLLLGIGLSRVKELLKHGNFRLYDVGSAVKIVHGLTDHRTTSIPLHRVQALQMRQSLWWRPFGWWRVRLNVAGAPKDDMDHAPETVVLPVGSIEDALEVLTLIDPQLSTEDLAQAALGDGTTGGWTLVDRAARWLDWLSWRRRGYAVSHHGVLIRTGRLTRVVTSVPHARIQSLGIDQGPIDRGLGLADVRLVSTPGPIVPRIDHLARREAEAFLAAESVRASVARRRVVSAPSSPGVPESPYSGAASTTASAEGDGGLS